MFQNKIKTTIAAFLLTFFTQQASAALFLITPNVGYKNHTIKLTANSGTESDIKMSGLTYGLKLGLQTFAGVGFDIAGSYAADKAKETTANIETENEYKHTTVAAQVSVSANLFKIYLGYLFMNDFTYTSAVPGGSFKLKGPGYQAGLAVLLTQSISIGAQYEVHQFNKINFDSVGNDEDIKTYFSKLDSQSTSLNLSISF